MSERVAKVFFIISTIVLFLGGYTTALLHHNFPKSFPAVSLWISVIPGIFGVIFFGMYKNMTKIVYKHFQVFFENQFKSFKLKMLMASVLDNMSPPGLPHRLSQKKKYENAHSLISECKKEDEKIYEAAKTLWNEHWYSFHIQTCLGILGKKDEKRKERADLCHYTLKDIDSMIEERKSKDSHYEINSNLQKEITTLKSMEQTIKNGDWVDCPKEFQGDP